MNYPLTIAVIAGAAAIALWRRAAEKAEARSRARGESEARAPGPEGAADAPEDADAGAVPVAAKATASNAAPDAADAPDDDDAGDYTGVDPVPDGEAVEMEAVFMEKAAAGSVPYRLLSVGGQQDLMILKSLFQSEQIPFYVEFERMASLKPGINIGSYNDACVYVLDEDYDDALAVAEAYGSRRGDEPATGAADRIRNAAEFLFAGWYVPRDPAGRVVIFRKR